MRTKIVYQPLFSTMSTHEIIKLSGSETWTGCPAELLYIISILNDISSPQSLPAGFMTEILSGFENFSSIRWAVAGDRPNLMKSRYHLASVYKHAVAIYISQILRHLYETTTIEINSMASLDSTILHIQSISRDDSHFKGLVWPAFVIGAETWQISQRMAITRVFEDLWDIWRCQNVRNALNVLQGLWQRNDERKIPATWIGDIYNSGINWIFV